MALGNLFVTLTLKANDFSAGIKQTQKEMKELEKATKPVTKALTDIATPMLAVGAVVGGAFIAMAKQAADYGDALRDASIRTGVATEALAGYKLAADQSGTSFEDVNAGLLKMSKAALSAAQGSKQGAAGFKAIGVAVTDSAGKLRPMEAILSDVADRFSKMKDGTEKAALAQQLFGKRGATMIEFLNQGKAGLEEARKRAEEFGLVLGKDAVDAADRFNDSLKDVKEAELGLANTIGQMLLPALTKVVDFVTSAIIAFRKFIEAHPGLTKAVFVLAAALSGAGGLLLGLTAVVAVLPQLTVAFGLMTGPIGLVVLAIGGLIAAAAAFPRFRAIVSDTIKNVIGLFAGLGSMVSSIALSIQQLATGRFSAAWETIKTSGTRSMDAVVRAADGYDNAIKSASGFTDIFKNNAKASAKVLDGELAPAAAKATTEADKFKQAVKDMIDSILGVDKSSRVFVEALHQLDAGGQMSAAKILELKNKINDLKDSNDPLIQKYQQLIPLLALATTRYEAQQSAAAALASVQRDLSTIPVHRLLMTPEPTIAAPGPMPTNLPGERAVKALEELKRLQKVPSDVAAAIREMSAAGKSNAEIMAVMAGDIQDAAAAAKALGIPLDANTKLLVRQAEATKRAEEAAEDWRKAWSTAMGNIESKFAEGLTAMIFHTGKMSLNVKDVFKELGTSLTQITVTQIFSPIFKAFSDFLGALTKPLTDFVSGLMSKLLTPVTDFIGGLIDKFTKKAVDAVANVATSAATAAATNAAGSAAGSAASAAGSMAGVGGGASGAVSAGASTAMSVAGIAVQAAGSIGVIFQLKRIEGTMNAVEANTRFTYIELKDTMEQILWPIRNFIEFIANQTESGRLLLASLDYWGAEIVDAIGRGGIPQAAAAPAGSPAVAAMIPAQAINITIDARSNPVITVNGARDPKATADDIWDRIDRNTDEIATKLATRMKQIFPGIVTVPA